MSQVKIELNRAGIDELLKSQEMEDAVHAETRKVAERLGGAYDTDVKMMPTRVISSVFTTDKAAIRDNMQNNTLLKAVSG